MTRRSTSDKILENVGEGFGYLQAYIKNELATIRLEAAEKTANVTSGLVTGFAIFSLANLIILFLSMALGFYLGALLDSTALGFLLVAVLFLFILVILYIFRQTLITNVVVTAIIKRFYHKENTENKG